MRITVSAVALILVIGLVNCANHGDTNGKCLQQIRVESITNFNSHYFETPLAFIIFYPNSLKFIEKKII